MIKIHWPHKNLGCLGLTIGSRYFDLSLPNREGFGKSWWNALRFYWRSRHDGKRHYFYLPSFRHVASR